MKEDSHLPQQRSPSDSASIQKTASKLSKHPAILKEMQQHQNGISVKSKPFGRLSKDNNPPLRTSLNQKTLLPDVALNKEPKRSSTVSNYVGVESEKQSTKQTFNQRLNHNIIRDEGQSNDAVATKQSFRIKKVTDTRSPKKMREDLMSLNQEEFKLQKQIVELHKKHKDNIEAVMAKYQISTYRPTMTQSNITESQQADPTLEDLVAKLEHRLKEKTKNLQKYQKKIMDNAYVQYVLSRPQSASIPERDSSEEEDMVEELPNKPRIQTNIGSYSLAMAGIKNKSYGLNLRRTYDVFKEEDRKSEVNVPSGSHSQPQEKDSEGIQIQEGENKMTLNNKFKDFLLN